ncbi:MAG: sulfotransferase domain-containing protein [Chitinophagaceae bacterium]|nr:sulfotransferase domain-containing protein [Chitinophagaceae bacterium]
MAVPNFLCVGAQKAGTTTLYEILKQHPSIFLPQKVKETKFFVYEEKYAKGVKFYEQAYFSDCKDQSAIGEVDPAMMYEENAAQRIFETLGDKVKLIFIFRNPVSRAYSHYLMSKRKGFEELSFDEAIATEAVRLKANPSQKFNFSYLTRGYYTEQVNRFKKYFKEENMLFLVFEDDFIKNRNETFNRIQDFLGVKRAALNLQIKSNEAAVPRNKAVHELTRKKNPVRNVLGMLLPSGAKKWLQRFIAKKNSATTENAKLDKQKEKQLIDKFFINDIHQLEKLIHRDLSTWYGGGELRIKN